MFAFIKQKTACGMRISDWSSDVCSSDLTRRSFANQQYPGLHVVGVGELVEQRTALDAMGVGELGDVLRQGFRVAGSSEERRVGKECGRTRRSRWAPYHETKQIVAASDRQRAGD